MEFFDELADLLPLAKQRQVGVIAMKPIGGGNIREINLNFRFIFNQGIDVWRIQLGVPLGRLREYPELVLPPNELPALAEFLVTARERSLVRISVGDNIGYFSHHEPKLLAEKEPVLKWFGEIRFERSLDKENIRAACSGRGRRAMPMEY